MKKFKRGLKLMVLILLIVLATLGVAITGVAPTFQKSRDRNEKVNTEQIEEGKEEEEANLEMEAKN